MPDQPPSRRRTMSVVIQILAAIFVAEISMKHLPAEVRAQGWTPTAYAMVGVCLAIVGVVLWSMVRQHRRARAA
ncbi:hypothetical protein [Mobilicoccus caccae]|nr:hypothetical protein [Mobilicoccus caccae]